MPENTLSYEQLLQFFMNRGASLDALQDMGGAALREDYASFIEREIERTGKSENEIVFENLYQV